MSSGHPSSAGCLPFKAASTDGGRAPFHPWTPSDARCSGMDLPQRAAFSNIPLAIMRPFKGDFPRSRCSTLPPPPLDLCAPVPEGGQEHKCSLLGRTCFPGFFVEGLRKGHQCVLALSGRRSPSYVCDGCFQQNSKQQLDQASIRRPFPGVIKKENTWGQTKPVTKIAEQLGEGRSAHVHGHIHYVHRCACVPVYVHTNCIYAR